MCIYSIVKIGIYSYNKELYTYKVAQYSSSYCLSMQRPENPKTSIVYCSAPTYVYIYIYIYIYIYVCVCVCV